MAAAGRWFEADSELDVVVVVVVVVDQWSRPAGDRYDPLVCVDDRGRYLGVLRVEQLVQRLLTGLGGRPR